MAGAGPVGGPGGDDPGATGSQPLVAPIGPFTVGAAGDGGASSIALDPVSIAFAGFEWAVPAFVLTVPGLLLILAVLGQALIGLAWVPLARRWVDGDRRARVGPGVRPSGR